MYIYIYMHAGLCDIEISIPFGSLGIFVHHDGVEYGMFKQSSQTWEDV